jgi:hypothetical protein
MFLLGLYGSGGAKENRPFLNRTVETRGSKQEIETLL